MNRKRSSAAQCETAPSPSKHCGKRAPSSGRTEEITAAMDTLVHGYREESELYTLVRKLTWRQHDTLREGWDLDRFSDLLEEKEDLLRMIGQIEGVMKSAKAVIMSRKPKQCPARWKLETLLDQLTALIEEIRIVETANATLIEGALAAS